MPHAQASDCRMNGSGNMPHKGAMAGCTRGATTGMRRSLRSAIRAAPCVVLTMLLLFREEAVRSASRTWGNVWQVTDEFEDEHTRGAILRGGSYYQPQSSIRYFPQAYKLDEHGKLLRMAATMDRSGAVGFRCVKEAQELNSALSRPTAPPKPGARLVDFMRRIYRVALMSLDVPPADGT